MNRIISLALGLYLGQSALASGELAINLEQKAQPPKNEGLQSDINQPSHDKLQTLYPSFADIVEPLTSAVVNIYTAKHSKKSNKPQRNPFSEGWPFDNFNDLFEQFNMPFNQEDMYSDPKAISLGSGFIIDSSGLIVTNHHVVNNADEINVKLSDNTELTAKVIGSDQKTDLALLKVESKSPLPFVKFGDSSKTRIGDWVITIGNPFGLGGTVTTGIISSKGRDLDFNSSSIVDNFIQTDAAINSGNSGGPMFNLKGEVIGVNTAIVSPSGVNVGIGFAIPSDTARSIINQLQKDGKINRGRLDISIQEVNNTISEELDIQKTTDSGALVRGVFRDGAGEKAGLKPGDIIIEFAGQPVANPRRLQILVAEAPVNKEIKMVVLRDGKTKELSGMIKADDDSISRDGSKTDSLNKKLGSLEKNNIIFNNLTDELKKKYNIRASSGKVIITNIFKTGTNAGLKVGDLVILANQQSVDSVEQLNKIYSNAKANKKKNIVLLVERQDMHTIVALPIE